MTKHKIANSSIAFKLLLSTIIIFVVMMVLSNYVIGLKQTQLSDELEKHIADVVTEAEDDSEVMLVINMSQIRTTREYQIFSAFIIGGAILVGGAIFAWVILRVLRPLNDLTETINRVDIDNLPEVRKEIAIESGSVELVKLAKSFQNALDKIYEDYDKQKRFSANVAHELRTPLAVLLMKADVFKKQAMGESAEVQTFVETMEINIIRLTKLVEDVLFLSRDYAPQIKKVSVWELAEEVLFDLEEKAKAKQISLSITGEALEAYTDDLLLERAIYNLVDNAINYTKSGGNCEIQLREEEQNFIVCIADDGPGIATDQKELVFDLFYRAEKSRNRETGGSGIGLAIVRDAVRRLGGTVTVNDNHPSGSLFKITIPKTKLKTNLEPQNSSVKIQEFNE